VTADIHSWALQNTIGDLLLLDGGITKTNLSPFSTDVLVTLNMDKGMCREVSSTDLNKLTLIG